MKFITFGLGGAKALFLRLGFGSTAKAAESRVNGGVLRGQFRPAIYNRPILLDVRQVSRVRVRVRFTSKTEVSCRVSRVHPSLAPVDTFVAAAASALTASCSARRGI